MLGYALSLPGVASTIVGTGSMEHLESNARIATNFSSMDQQKRKALTEQVIASIPAGLPQPWDLPGYAEDCAIA
jgi:aryl-alcohol dehydrogenase-like predicted oxidoreductase